MPPSQLTQLKTSLHTHGLLGPQKSKKEKKSPGAGKVSNDAIHKRNQRAAALEKIREEFNPFETTRPARPKKWDVVSNKMEKVVVGRPGVTRGLGEERRRETLLREMRHRGKVGGGMVDRRFGEGDGGVGMSVEEKMAVRYAREMERGRKGRERFELEIDDDEGVGLTHGGRSLDFGGEEEGEGGLREDYVRDEIDVMAEQEEGGEERPLKRVRLNEGEGSGGGEEGGVVIPERRKTKNEVMQEVIAKSRMHKAERQAAKADDDDLRLQLDQGMSDFYQALSENKRPKERRQQQPLPTPPSDSEPQMNPARAAMLAGKSREDAEKEYEANIRQMKMDARSQPSVRTNTEEEKAVEEAERLRELERKRLMRMTGEEDSEDDNVEEIVQDVDDDNGVDDAEMFGLAQPQVMSRPQLEVEDEDEFELDDQLIASDSEAEAASGEEDSSEGEESGLEDDGDDDFINGLVLPKAAAGTEKANGTTKSSKNLAFTYPCPQTHDELLELLEDKDVKDLPTIVQRIRALYHKGLGEDNQTKLAAFAHVLLDHVVYMVDENEETSFSVAESLLRHLHSMAKSQPHDVSAAFRAHLLTISEQRPLALTPGDLIVLSGISIIFPTSDHYHPVATPAILTIARYLGQSTVQSLQDLGVGLFCCTLALQYQELAKRYLPEVITYMVNAVAILSRKPVTELIESGDGQKEPLSVPFRLPKESSRIEPTKETKSIPEHGKFSFRQLITEEDNDATFSISLLSCIFSLAEKVVDLWAAKSAFPEASLPLIHVLTHLDTLNLPNWLVQRKNSTLERLRTTHQDAILNRKPLLLHNHRALAIKTSVPLFQDSYNPSRRYDPDIERAQLAKLRAEHKKERKGAIRELRKDANFIAREQLREKKEKDEAYEKKFKRLVAEIQGEEGKESKEYEREKRKRKGR